MYIFLRKYVILIVEYDENHLSIKIGYFDGFLFISKKWSFLDFFRKIPSTAHGSGQKSCFNIPLESAKDELQKLAQKIENLETIGNM